MKELLINFESIILKDSSNHNWYDLDNVKLLVESIVNNGFFSIEYYLYEGRERIPFSSFEEIINKIIDESISSIHFYSEKESDKDKVSLFFQEEEITLTFLLTYRDSLSMSELEGFLSKMIKSFEPVSYFGPSIYVAPLDVMDIPRVRPPKRYGYLIEHSLINIFDKTYFEKHPDNYMMTEEMTRIMISKIEENEKIKKTIDGDKLFVTWIKSLKMYDVEQGVSDREDFIEGVIELKPEIDYNKLGDKKRFHISALEKLSDKEYFNYYDQKNGVGIKLIILDKNLELNEDDVSAIKEYSKSKELKDGRVLNKIVSILPDRKYVKEIDGISNEIGIYENLYLDNELNCWDIKPSGNWKN